MVNRDQLVVVGIAQGRQVQADARITRAAVVLEADLDLAPEAAEDESLVTFGPTVSMTRFGTMVVVPLTVWPAESTAMAVIV